MVYNFVNHRQDRMTLETKVDQKLGNLKKEKHSILGELKALRAKEMGANDGIQTGPPSAALQQDVGSDFMEVLQLQGVYEFYYFIFFTTDSSYLKVIRKFFF